MSRRPDLYRFGNTTSARFENVRPQDIQTVTINGVKYVKPRTGGISTAAVLPPNPDRTRTWVLGASVALGSLLLARNDHGTHWAIEPSSQITFDAYVGALRPLNNSARRLDQVTRLISEEEFFTLPKSSSHDDQGTRFIFNALSAIVRDRIPVTGIADWDENDYLYIANIAKDLEDGEVQLSDIVWRDVGDDQNDHYKEAEFTAAAVAGYMAHEEATKLGVCSEDDEADLRNDHVFLRTLLKFDAPDCPFTVKYGVNK
ncbi:hypothetical protein BDY19DRAFT_898505 [Irpex rosettiformis]|uniref:Uncharacterized protein n=1 Tax=Irpex rosettiformis TaxID=378272 RepID=A0ACB8TRI4_9APHY|nr:hypothetical protein BDY19DRAFT_898505 [Irpex rosettiformis]